MGLWLALRGGRKLYGIWQHRGHTQHAYGSCGCGHKHGPSAEEAGAVHSLRDAIMVIGSVAIRPCTGALFLLILTWRLEIDLVGIAGAFVMGLGTASVTVIVAVLSVVMRESAFGTMAGSASALKLSAVLELGAGLLIAVVAFSLV